MLGILHTRLLEGSPLARRPLSELAGPLTAMIVLPYVGHAAASTSASNGADRPASKVRRKAGARKRKRGRLTAKQRALVAALQDGPLTVRELVDATGMSDQTVRDTAKGLEARERVVKTERDGKIAYALPSKGRAAAGRKVAAGSSTSNGAASSNGVGVSTSNGGGSPNGAAASNGHDRFTVTRAMLQALDPQISKREFEVLAVIGELNTGGSSPSNPQIGNATKIHDPTQLSKLIQRLAHLWLVQNDATGKKPYGWRLTTRGTELLRELEGQAVGGTHPADARA